MAEDKEPKNRSFDYKKTNQPAVVDPKNIDKILTEDPNPTATQEPVLGYQSIGRMPEPKESDDPKKAAEFIKLLEGLKKSGLLLEGNPTLLDQNKVPDKIRNNPDVQTAIILATAEDIKLSGIMKGMANKYKNAPEITNKVSDGEDITTRQYLGGKHIRVSKEDAKIIENAQWAVSGAMDEASRAIKKTAPNMDIDTVRAMANTLRAEQREIMAEKSASGANKGSQRGFSK